MFSDMTDFELIVLMNDLRGTMIANYAQLVFQYRHIPDDAICKMLFDSNDTMRTEISKIEKELNARGLFV